MARRERREAQQLAASGASFQEIRQETGLKPQAIRNVMSNWSSGASSQPSTGGTQQPMPNYNPTFQNARYITDLNPVGSPEFNAWNEKVGGNYDGGGWVTWNKNLGPGDSGMLASDDDMRRLARANAYRQSNNIGLMQQGSDESDASRWAAQQAAQAQTSSPAANTNKYKDLKSIAGGLRIGGDNILGRREAMKIARGTGRDFDKVLTKALGQGMSIGGGAVRQSNRASGTSQLTPTIKGQQMFTSGGSDDPLSAMRRVTPGKRQMYSGTYELDGQTMPLVESRRGGVASTLGGMGDGRRNRNKNNRRNKRGRGGAGDMESTGMETSQTPQTPMTPMEPMTPEQMQEASTIDINMPGVGADVFSSATGYRSKRSSRKLAGRTAAGLASQRINPTGSWRYGV